MKRFFTPKPKSLLLAALSLLCLGANAQQKFSTTVVQKPNTTWDVATASFKMTDVASAFSTETSKVDTATLAAELNANAITNKMYQLYSPATDSYVSSYNGEGAMFWIGRDGELHNYAEGGIFYAGLTWDTSSDMIGINFGQFPDSIKTGGTFNPQFKLVYGDKEVIFDVTYNVPKAESLAAAPTLLKDLSIAGSTELTFKQEAQTTWAQSVVKVPVKGITDALGVSSEALSNAIANSVYFRTCGQDDVATDSLQLATVTDGWTHVCVYGLDNAEHAGETSNEVAARAYGSTDAIYLQKWAFDSDTLSFNVGQMPGSLKADSVVYANIYICNGTKGYMVKFTLQVTEASTDDLDVMTEVGSVDVVASKDPEAGYGSFTIDVDAIAEKLGCKTEEVSFRALAAAGKLSKQNTAYNGGWWFDANGYVCSWGSNASFYTEPASDKDYTKMNTGTYNVTNVGDKFTTKLYAVNNGNYVTINYTLNIVEKEIVNLDEFAKVERTATINQELGSSEFSSEMYTISNADLLELIGTTEPTLYTLNIDSIAEKTGAKYTDTYSCTPYPGFWLTDDGRKTTWASSSPWAISIGQTTDQDGITFQCIQFGSNTAGEKHTGKFYLANLEAQKMIVVTLTYIIGGEKDETETVGEMNLTLPVTNVDYSESFDLTTIATKLDLGEDALSGYYLRAMAEDGTYGTANSATDGIQLNKAGYYVSMSDIGIQFAEEDGDVKIITYSNVAVSDDLNITPTICFQKDNKRYVIHLVLLSQPLYDGYVAGISNVAVDSKAGKIYNISGMEVKNPVKGLYIQNGKKYIK